MIVSEDYMILTFLQAEISSPRFARYLGKHDMLILTLPDLSCPKQNKERKRILTKYRGFGNRTKLFHKFPKKVLWETETFLPNDIKKLKTINHTEWNRLTKNSRYVTSAVLNLSNIYVRGITENIIDVYKSLCQGIKLPSIIITQDLVTNNRVILEGHTRAVAYALANCGCEAIIGYGKFKTWQGQRI